MCFVSIRYIRRIYVLYIYTNTYVIYIGVSYRLLVWTNVEKYTENTLSSCVVILSLPYPLYYCKSIYTSIIQHTATT